MRTSVSVLRVFCAPDGSGGNPLGVVLDGTTVPDARDRQRLARLLAYSETVFVDDAARGSVRIYSPGMELPFAGHPLVGAAWLLARSGSRPGALRPPAGAVPIRYDGDLTFIAARPEWASTYVYDQVGSPVEVDAVAGVVREHDGVCVWAWLDEPRGIVRARVFPAASRQVDEDEATGAAAVRMVALLRRSLEVHQGRGSVLFARPLEEGYIEVGGRVALEGTREIGAV